MLYYFYTYEMLQTFFCIGLLVWLGFRELRKWVEACININQNNDENDKENDKEEPIPDSVKHMYN